MLHPKIKAPKKIDKQIYRKFSQTLSFTTVKWLKVESIHATHVMEQFITAITLASYAGTPWARLADVG